MSDNELLQAITSIIQPMKDNIENIKEQLASMEKTDDELQENLSRVEINILESQQKINEFARQN